MKIWHAAIIFFFAGALLATVVLKTFNRGDQKVEQSENFAFNGLSVDIRELATAAMLGDKQAPIKLSTIYGKISPSYAKYWERIGAENGNPISQYNFALRTIHDDPTEYDRYRAMFWLQRASDLGDKDASELLSILKKKEK